MLKWYTYNVFSKSTKLLDLWSKCLNNSQNINKLYHSPDWIEHLIHIGVDVKIGLETEDSDSLCTIIFVIIENFDVKFEIYERVLYKKKLKCAKVLGSYPLINHKQVPYEALISEIFKSFPDIDAIYLDSINLEHELYQNLKGLKLQNCEVHWLDDPRKQYILGLPNNFDDFLLDLSAKTRNSIKRKKKILEKEYIRKLKFTRVENKVQINNYLQDMTQISKNSWQYKVLGSRIENNDYYLEKLKDIANRNILRSYILSCGNDPCAFVLGYQFKKVFHYVEIAYDQSFKRFSPGLILLFHVVEDLINYNSPEKLNFGVGYARYKEQFSNLVQEDISALIYKKNIKIIILINLHKIFNKFIYLIKNIIKN
jgi:hypothetical protein